jgi:hypothetical protein
VDEALGALAAERRRRRDAAALEIADLLADALTHVEEIALDDERQLAGERDRLERSFHGALRAREAKARARVEAIYAHRAARFEQDDLARPLLEKDLFAEETWRLLGLGPGQILAAGALAGAGAGGVIDAAVGGASVLAGTLVGGAVGAGAALYGMGRRFARARPVGAEGVLGLATSLRRTLAGGRRFRIGPHAGPNFPWVVLDRALLHYRAVATRTHARRGAIPVEGSGVAGLVAGLGRDERRVLEAAFRRLRRRWSDPPREERDAIARALGPVLGRLDPAGEGVSPR